MTSTSPKPPPDPRLRPLPQRIFASRWLQLPLYLGLIVAHGVDVWQFCPSHVRDIDANGGH